MIALGLGSNISNTTLTREDNIATAIRLLGAHPKISIEKVSSLYETEPVGLKEQPSFLNAAVAISTELQPLELLDVCLTIERQMGRVREVRWGPRNIDIDLLVYHELEISVPQLELPHPRMSERKFVLIPLVEIAEDIPVNKGKTAKQLLACTQDDSQVNIYGKIKFVEQAKAIG